jgi:hypothetical protein
MKKLIPVVFLLFSSLAFAQTNWQPMFITVSGHNVKDGVEGWFAQGECNGEAVVFVKFVNTNAAAVSLSWNDGIFTQALNWVNKTGMENTRNLRMEPSIEMAGHCGGQPLLVISIAEFDLTATDFMRYNAHGLTITFE